MKLVPTYEHDCDKCQFITSVYLIGRVVDVYKKCNSHTSEYIIRYSNEGSEYSTTHNRNDLPLEEHYLSHYGRNPELKILSLDQYVCEQIEALVKQLE